MSEPAQPARKAWQPFTPSGVARFATASLNRLLLVQAVVAFLVAAGAVWFLGICYSPIILAAIQTLPDTGKISAQQLHGVETGLLAENRFLSIGVETGDSTFAGVGDLQIRLSRESWNTCSLVGCLEWIYPKERRISLSRTALEPWWGAWQPMILAGVGLLLMSQLVVSWWLLAVLYVWIPKLMAFFSDRELTWTGSMKLSCAAQLPGAVFVVASIFLYGLSALDLIRFLIFYTLHLPISWGFLLVATAFLPKIAKELPTANPFSTENPESK